ncbi:MAG: hypothetical protein Alpg2KO_04400 [Alphaproteobacteria bacterium]
MELTFIIDCNNNPVGQEPPNHVAARKTKQKETAECQAQREQQIQRIPRENIEEPQTQIRRASQYTVQKNRCYQFYISKKMAPARKPYLNPINGKDRGNMID